MNAMTTKSLAGTTETYIIIQARIKGGNIKFQGLGKPGNRDYGFTEEIDADELPELKSFIEDNM